MKVSELKERKTELGYSNEMVSELSGVPLGTVQKIFGGVTKVPRYGTLKKIEKVLFPEIKPMNGVSVYDDLIRSSSPEEPILVGEGTALDFYDMHDDDFGEAEKEKQNNYFEFGNEAYFGKKQGEYTVDDWHALPDGLRMELIDGKLYNMAPPTVTHQHYTAQIFTEIEIALRKEKQRKCMALISPVGVQLNNDKNNMLQPDVAIVCDKEKLKGGREVHGAPDFVAEVLSPSTAGYDRVLKLDKYWMGGVREYWIIDTVNEDITVYNFESGKPPVKYTFEDTVPIDISEGLIEIDFAAMTAGLKEFIG